MIDNTANQLDNEAALMAVKRELFFTPSNQKAANNPAEFKTPSLKEWQDANKQVDRQNSARLEARAKAHAKADQDLGLSPPDYIENLKDKLRRKPSVDEDAIDILPIRTRSFSEPNVEPEKSWNLPPRPNLPDQIPPVVADTPPAKPPRMMLPPTSMIPAPVELPRMPSNPPANSAFNSPLKSSKSMSQMASPSVPVIPPPSPRSDVIGSLFLQQQQNGPSSSSPTSPPQSPRSVGSSKSTSYLWAGLAPAESQLKLEPDSGASASASASTPSTTNEVCRLVIITIIIILNSGMFHGVLQQGVKVKKSKDRERRRSIIQTITGLFTSSKKDETPKDPDSEKSKKSTPSKFQLPKFSPKKDKSKVFTNSGMDCL